MPKKLRWRYKSYIPHKAVGLMKEKGSRQTWKENSKPWIPLAKGIS